MTGRLLTLPAWAFITVLAPSLAFASPPRSESDRGTLALLALLRLEGLAVTAGELRQRLPEQPAGGYSLAQLRDAARACGVPADGVQLNLATSPLNRPAIVYLDRGDHGHFLLIRPVGHSGHLVQTIDSTGPPAVITAPT